MRSALCFALLCLVGVLALPGRADEPAPEKLLLGFEEDEFVRMQKAIKLTRKEGKTKDGKAYVAWEHPGGFAQLGQWMTYEGNASEGKRALGIGLVTNQDYITYSPSKLKLPKQPLAYYGMLNNPYASQGAMLNTCGVFRRVFPIDWSDYDLLRLDAYAEGVEQTVRVILEDEEISPPIVRNLSVQPGKWVTLEIDLRAAAKERGLDPKRMATLAVGVAEQREKPKKASQPSALIDNLRLARRDAKAKLPVVRDTSSLRLPDYYRASKPEPERLPEGKPDRSPIELTKPFLIPSKSVCNVAPIGWAAAYDNKRLLVGFDAGGFRDLRGDVYLLQSLDGGQSWRGLDGGEKPTPLYVFNNDHGSGRGDVVGARADVLLFNNLGCAGPNIASLRLFARKVTFTGEKGWELRKEPALVDCDLRHCNSNHSIVRAPDGRLWAAYGFVGRLGTNCMNVRYSDDDGLSWKGWSENKSVLPGSIRSEKKGVGFGYTFEEPCLVPFGKGVACLWQQREGYDFTKLLWTHFDGKEWGPIEEIERPKRTVVSNPVTRPPVHAVSLGGKEIFLVGALWDGVLHYADGKWKVEAAEVPAGSRISAAGDRAVVVIAPVSKGANKGPVVLRSWQRSRKGGWSKPVDLAREEEPLSHSHDGIYVVRPGLVVQAHALLNFVPVAWTCEKQKWVKYLRVPVSE